MRREADEIRDMNLGKLEVEVHIWIDPTYLDPADTTDQDDIAEFERTECNGHDVYVEARAAGFVGRDSCGGFWVTRDAVGDRQLHAFVSEVITGAMHDLRSELKAVALGRDVARAEVTCVQASKAAMLAGAL